MQPLSLLAEEKSQRKSVTNSIISESLITKESFLRRRAYKNTTIKTDKSFFDDSDMKSEYYLLVVYDEISNTPLLSCRYYFEKSVIGKYLRGDNNLEPEFNLKDYPEGKIFLADRLSGNINSSIYRLNRNKIFSLFYSEIINNNKNCTLLLMVRKEKRDQQLSKYLNLGFIPIGSTLHKGKEHSIIQHNLENV